MPSEAFRVLDAVFWPSAVMFGCVAVGVFVLLKLRPQRGY